MFSVNLLSKYWPASAVRVIVLATTLGILTGCTTSGSGPSDPELVEVHGGAFDQVYMHPDRPLPQIRRIAIEEPVVEMNEQWLRDHRRDYTQRDLERIKETYGGALAEALREAFEETGQIQIVNSAADADVVLRPNLRRLNIYAPDLTSHGRRDQYVETAGNATFDVQLVDPTSEQVLAQFVDHRETRSIAPGQIEETNRGMNYRMFRRMMDHWSQNLVDHLKAD